MDGTGVLSQTLSSLGADLTFSVSWSVAHELLDGASESQLGEDELIGIVLGVSVVLTALPKALMSLSAELPRFWRWATNKPPPSDAATPPAEGSGLIAFIGVFVSIAQRISVSLVVQLLAANVRSQQPLRSVRILTLLSVAVFFLFLESTATVGRVAPRKAQ